MKENRTKTVYEISALRRLTGLRLTWAKYIGRHTKEQVNMTNDQQGKQ